MGPQGPNPNPNPNPNRGHASPGDKGEVGYSKGEVGYSKGEVGNSRGEVGFSVPLTHRIELRVRNISA